MGDRAYVRITCQREDAGRFQQLGFVEEDSESDIAVSMVDEEANYAHYSALTALAKAGIVFYGWRRRGFGPRPEVLHSAGSCASGTRNR